MTTSPASCLTSAQMALDEGELDEAESYLAQFEECQVSHPTLRRDYKGIKRELSAARAAVAAQ